MQFFKNPTSYYDKLEEVVKNYKLRLDTHFINTITNYKRIISDYKTNLSYKLPFMLESKKNALNALKIKLEALSPTKPLERGYSLTTNEEGKVITSINDISINQELKTTLKDGIITSTVVKKG